LVIAGSDGRRVGAVHIATAGGRTVAGSAIALLEVLENQGVAADWLRSLAGWLGVGTLPTAIQLAARGAGTLLVVVAVVDAKVAGFAGSN
jgi:hypothetical protein